VFDSSYERGQPAEFPLRGVIKCWTEGMQKIKVGGKAKLTCPAEIAYGDRSQPKIPGGSALIFEVELLEVKKQEAPAPGAPGAMPGTPMGRPGDPTSPRGRPARRGRRQGHAAPATGRPRK